MDREKVVNGLRSIKTYLASQAIEATDSFAREGFIESQKDIDDALALLKEQETVVRCKDCKYYDYHNGCMSWHDVNSKNDNWYCADGAYKENNNE